MMRGVRLYLVGSLALVTLAGCGRGFFQVAEREPWRREAEVSCLKSGALKENPNLVRVEPIAGPGICGAEYPLKITALGTSSLMGYSGDMRPPGAVPNAGQDVVQTQRSALRWPVRQEAYPGAALNDASAARADGAELDARGVDRAPANDAKPMSLYAPGVRQPPADHEMLPDEVPQNAPGPRSLNDAARELNNPSPNARQNNQQYDAQDQRQDTRQDQRQDVRRQSSPPALGPARGPQVASIGPVALKPVATLACPVASALDRWITAAVQPAAMRWFGTPVAEIKQISAYSCRGMNGNSNARISEHAFGNALDIAAFTLADGRTITVKNGWKGLPEEQGFLRDVQAAACQQFSTVLAPGSNVYHYDHIHVDLMRRSSGRTICQPGAVSGEEIAARASGGRYARDNGRDGGVTGSITSLIKRATTRNKPAADDDDGIEDESNIR